MLPGIRTLAIPDFRRLFYGQVVSQFGDGLYYLMVLFVANKVSGGQPWAVALVGFCQAIPFLLLGPFAGRTADRVDRKLLMIGSDVASAAVTFALAIYALASPKVDVWVLAFAGFVLSSAAVFFMPARSASIPNLVPEESLLEANGLAVAANQVVTMAAQGFSVLILGPIDKLFPASFFPMAAAINGLTFLGSLIFLLKLPSLIPSKEGREERGMLAEIKDGIDAVRADAFVPPALLISGVFNIFVSGWMVVHVRANREWFGDEFWTLALCELSFFAVLAVFSLIISSRKISRIGVIFFLGNFFTGAMCLFMAWASNYPTYLLLNGLCGIFVALIWLPAQTYIQSAFPDHLRGRVSSLWNMIHQGTQPLGYAVIGPLLAWVGLLGTFLVMGFGMIFGSLLGMGSKRFRESRMPAAGSSSEQEAAKVSP